MGLIQNWIARRKEKKEIEANMENQINAGERIEARRKSANERELEKYIEMDRKKRIDKALATYRKKEQHEFWHGRNLMKQRNLFKEESYNSILKDKNIFK